MNKDRIAGSAKQAKGAAKRTAGKVLGDSKLVTDGEKDKAKGKIQNAYSPRPSPIPAPDHCGQSEANGADAPQILPLADVSAAQALARQSLMQIRKDRCATISGSRSERLAAIEPLLPMLHLRAASLTRDRQHALDLVRDCLVNAFVTIEQCPEGTPLRAWLLAMLQDVHEGGIRLAPPGARSSREQASPRRAMAQLSDGLATLSCEERAVLLLVAVDGCSYESAAERLGMSPKDLLPRLTRARKKLRAQMENHSVRREQAAVGDRSDQSTSSRSTF